MSEHSPIPRAPRSPTTGRRARLALVAVLAVLGLRAAATAAAAPPVRPAATEPSIYALEVARLVNEERLAIGLDALAADQRLYDASEAHTEWMVANEIFSHRGEGGSTPADRALAEGYVYTALGESLARGHTSPEQVVRGRTCDRYCITACDVANRCDGWKQSSSHWRILMGSSYRDIGSAYLSGPPSRPHWWTVMVGNSQSATEPLSGAAPAGTATPTQTRAPTVVASATPTRTPSPTHTPWLVPPTLAPTWTPYVPPTAAPTRTPRPSATPSRTPTRLPQPSLTPTPAAGTSGIRGRVDVLGLGPRQGVAVYVDGAHRAITDAQGRFAVTGLSSGRHTVEARAPGMLLSRGQVDVLPGVTRDVGATALVPGDVYPSGAVDLLDLLMAAAAQGRCPGAALYDPVVDLDADGCVDDDDYLLVYENVGRSGPTAWTTRP